MSMNKLLYKEQGFGHVVLLVAVVAILGVLAFAGFRVVNNNKSDTSTATSQSTSKEKKYDDQRVDNSVLNNLQGTEDNEQ